MGQGCGRKGWKSKCDNRDPNGKTWTQNRLDRTRAGKGACPSTSEHTSPPGEALPSQTILTCEGQLSYAHGTDPVPTPSLQSIPPPGSGSSQASTYPGILLLCWGSPVCHWCPLLLLPFLVSHDPAGSALWIAARHQPHLRAASGPPFSAVDFGNT